MRRKISCFILVLSVCMTMLLPVNAWADVQNDSKDVPMQASVQNGMVVDVTTADDLKNALQNEDVTEIHITEDFKYTDSLDSDKTIKIDEGVTLELSGYKINVSGVIINDGTIKIAASSDQCIYTAMTSGSGKIIAENIKWNEYQTYVDYGCVPDAMLEGSNCQINIVKDVSVQPTVSLPENMQTGDTITPTVTNLIDGVDIARVFKFTWKDGNSSQIYNGASSPTLTKKGTLKLNLATKKPYVMRSPSGSYGSIDASGTVKLKSYDTIYVDTASGSDSNTGEAAATPVQHLYDAVDKVAENGTIVLLNDCQLNSTFEKNVTIKSDNDKNCKITQKSRYYTYIQDGVTVTFDAVNLDDVTYTRWNNSAAGTGSLIFKNCSGTIDVGNGDIQNITLENSQLGGMICAGEVLKLKDSSIDGKFSTKDFKAEGDCTLTIKKNAPGRIDGTVETTKAVTLVPASLLRGEKLIEVDKTAAADIASDFVLQDTKNDVYAIRLGVRYNGTYLGISERVDCENGKIAISDEPALTEEVKNPSTNDTGFGNAPLSVKSAVWSGKTESNTWDVGDEPELSVRLSVDVFDNPFFHFDDTFDVTKLKIYSWADTEERASFDEAVRNTDVECLVKAGQGISTDGRNFTFTIKYPKLEKSAQNLTMNLDDAKTNCTEILEAREIKGAKGVLTYISSNESVATVDQDGKVHALKAGETTITVRAAETPLYTAAEASYKVVVSHNFSNEWKHDDSNHWKVCLCGEKDQLTAHAGGKADCKEKAKCDICGTVYGELDMNNHAGPLTWTKDSASHEQKCEACGTITVAKEAHTWNGNTCTKCEYRYSSSGSGSYTSPVQKPEIVAGNGGKATLSKDGTTLTITPESNMEIDSVLLNGKEQGKTTELKNLKTGDKVVITFKQKETQPTDQAELDKQTAAKQAQMKLTARSAKTGQENIRITLKGTDVKALEAAGYTVKYKYYRSLKKSTGYKAMLTKDVTNYLNTIGKKGTMYYYKVRVLVYDKEGKLVAQTSLKNCRYANRLWTK